MRITGPNASAAAVTAPAGKRPPQGGFTLNEADTPRAPTMPAALRTIGGIDALIALQGLEDEPERRKRAVKRGRVALDALDELKIGLLGGTLSQATLNKLRSAAAFLNEGAGEPGLDGVLGEIELRVQVEIAKMAPR
jgi:hypothetical protein